VKKKIVFGSVALILLSILVVAFIFIYNDASRDHMIPDPGTPSSGNGSNNTTPSPVDDIDLEGYVLLARLSQPDSTVPAESPRLSDRSYFRPADGLFRDVSYLTAWDNNTQVLIGATDGSSGTPVLFDSSSLTSRSWLSAQVAGIFNRRGFPPPLKSLGLKKNRFSAPQAVRGFF